MNSASRSSRLCYFAYEAGRSNLGIVFRDSSRLGTRTVPENNPENNLRMIKKGEYTRLHFIRGEHYD